MLVTLHFVQPRLMAPDYIAFLIMLTALGVASSPYSMEGAAWASSSGKLQGSEGSI
jgi:hypothetical protein